MKSIPGNRPRIMLIFGTRPEAIKMAPLVAELKQSPLFDSQVVVTAQHREILDQVLGLFDVVPDHDLNLISSRQTLTDITVRALAGLVAVLSEEQPDLVVVQGDTTTTFASALAAFYCGISVAHVEAGLRTGDVRAPYPEEMNRRLTTQLSAMHFAPTTTALAALRAEGVPNDAITVTGNTVIDALRWTLARRVPFDSALLTELESDPRRVLLVTAHRRESWGEGMARVAGALKELAESRSDLVIVFPIHPNPAVRETILPLLARLGNVLIIEPLPYGQFARLMALSDLILTDSGGVQEEGPSLAKPVLVMRDTTERPEAVHAGTVLLVGTDSARIIHHVGRLLDDKLAYDAMAHAINPYGDGYASQRIVQAIAHRFGMGSRPIAFSPD